MYAYMISVRTSSGAHPAYLLLCTEYWGFLPHDEVATDRSTGGLLPQDEVGNDISTGGFLPQDEVATNMSTGGGYYPRMKWALT